MFTIFACIVVICAFIWAYLYVRKSNNEKLRKKKKWIEQLPSLISTLGVIGTFVGITIGLVGFDADKLDSSIPQLLSGLKTAFFTSLFGMVGSLILSRCINHAYDKLSENDGPQNPAKLIVDAIKELQNGSLKEYIEQIADDLENTNATLNEIKQKVEEIVSEQIEQKTELHRISSNALTTSVIIAKLGNDIDEIKETNKDK